MSSIGICAVRKRLAICPLFLVSAPLAAQDDAGVTSAEASERVVIDILAKPAESPPDPREIEQCKRDQEAASISGEIIVCGAGRDDSQYRTLNRDAAQSRYARETAYVNDPQAPDVAGAGIFRGPATVGGLCIIPPCPPPKAVIIDVEALPEAPPGSDADRIARGLPPLDKTPSDLPGLVQSEAMPGKRKGRPELAGPVIDYSVPSDADTEQAETASPEGSAAPEGQR